MLSDETRARLSSVATSTLANCLLRRGLRNVLLLGVGPLGPQQPRMVGPAYTLRFMPAREDIDSMANYGLDTNLHRRAIEECPTGAVLVIETGSNLRASSAGDLMLARLKVRGVAGIVTDGGYRDTPAMREVGLPAYQRAPAPPATPIALHPVELNGPIGCAGVAVYPGDIVVGDAEGVAIIPAHLADEVAAEATDQEAYEHFAELHIAAGRPLFGLFPATEASRSEYHEWVRAGRPALPSAR
jgi:regulator of RNase E activity RraA